MFFNATRLKAAASDAGLTQQAIASQLGVSMATVQAWYRGKWGPSGGTLVLLAALLDREPEWFYGINDEAA